MTRNKKKLSAVTLALLVIFSVNIALADSYTLPSGTGLPNPTNGIAAILENLLTWVLGIFSIIAIISFIISGIQYFLAAGDEKMMQTAKRNATYSIVGVIVALAAYVIIQAVDTALNASSSIF